MRTIHGNSGRATIVLALSIAALPGLVNGQPQGLSSFNTDKGSIQSDLKDSVKDKKTDFAKLIALTLENGKESKIGSNLAPVIGLSKAMPMKKQEYSLPASPNEQEDRACYVIYENIEGTGSKAGEKRPVCAYVVKRHLSGSDSKTRYFRTDLNGKLVKAVLSEGKLDSNGQGVKGSGVKTDLDIESPEVKKTFEAEMKFWLKDWLKKEQKSPAKKTANAAADSPAAPPL